MKKIIVILTFVFANSIYSQNIETDSLFLEFENEFLNGEATKLDLDTYDKDLSVFYTAFVDSKASISFGKSKDKKRWLEKNLNKTTFTSLVEATTLYNKIEDFSVKYENASLRLNSLRTELEKKYNGKEVFYTIKKRLQANKNE